MGFKSRCITFNISTSKVRIDIAHIARFHREYRLNVPANAPVKLYWSATVYDRATHALVRNQPHSSRASNSVGLQQNADGSTALDQRPIERSLCGVSAWGMIALLLDWLDGAPLQVLSCLLFLSMMGALCTGFLIRQWQDRNKDARPAHEREDGLESYHVSAVLGLLALLVGFTFALAIDRFDARRILAVEDANAIHTAYLHSQLLDEPHRTQLRRLLVAYTGNMIALGKTRHAMAGSLLAEDSRLLNDLWAETTAASGSAKRVGILSEILSSMTSLIDLDAARRAAWTEHVPTEVFVVLIIYLIVTAGVLGYVPSGPRSRVIATFPLALLTLSLLLIIDIDRPASGNIRESEGPLNELLVTLRQPPAAHDDGGRENPL